MAKRNATATSTNPWPNRIVGYGEEATDQLLASSRNWRVHPRPQQEALSAVLHQVGIVQNIIVNRTTGTVVDGHLRVTLAMREHQPTVPVTYVELTEQEEALILATLDPLSAMAVADKAQLDALLREVTTDSEAITAMLSDLADDAGLSADGDRDDRTLEEIDAETLPERPVWCLATIAYAQLPAVMPILEQLKALGIRVELSNDAQA